MVIRVADPVEANLGLFVAVDLTATASRLVAIGKPSTIVDKYPVGRASGGCVCGRRSHYGTPCEYPDSRCCSRNQLENLLHNDFLC